MVSLERRPDLGRVRVLVFVLLLGACSASSGPVEVLVGPPDPMPRMGLLVVYPVDLRQDASAQEHYRKTHDLIAALGNGLGLALLGPTEFQLQDSRSRELSTSSNALLVARKLGYSPEQVGLLKVWVEQRAQSGLRLTYDKKGRARSQAAVQDLRFLVHAELWQYLPTRLLADLQVSVQHDPFAEHPDWDRHPEVRRAVQLLGRHVRRLILGPEPMRTSSGLGFAAFDSPVPVLSYQTERLETLAKEITALDPLMGELRLWRAFQYFRPEISLAETTRISKLCAGVVVQEVGERPLIEGLRSGDLIVEVRGSEIAYLFQLRRALGRAGDQDGSPQVVVLRKGERVNLQP